MKSSDIFDNDFDEKIKRTFDYVTKDIDVSDDMLSNVKNKVNGGNVMKLKSKKVGIAIAAAVLTITAATGIVASGGVKFWHGSSSNLTAKSDFPDKDTIKKEFDYNIKYVKEFSNGFKFDSYNYSDSTGTDEAGNVLVKSKDAKFDYVKNKGEKSEQKIYFSADKMTEDLFFVGHADKTENYKNINIYYSDYIYKCFPPDIEEKEVSDEDKAEAEKLMAEVRKTNPEAEDITKIYPYLSQEDIEAYKQNKLMCAYGSQEIETMTHQSVAWYEDGAAYNMLSMKQEWIDPDEFIDMAKQVIDEE